MSTEDTSHMFKLVALGNGAVGKTSCIKRYTEDSFNERYIATIGTTFALKTVNTVLPTGSTVTARIVLWDLAGQPTYNELRRRYMAGATMAIIVYDVTRPQTFLDIGEWFTKFITVCPNAVVAVVANKIDREDRLVPPEAGKMVTKWLDVLHYETSAKTGENVNTLFTDLVQRAIAKQAETGPFDSVSGSQPPKPFKLGGKFQYLRGAIGHLFLFLVNFSVLVGIIESLQLFTPSLPILNGMVLGYMLCHTFILLSIQQGVQILELIRMRLPTVLILYYFKISDQESIKVPLFDPTKNRLAVIILLLVITGGPILYPIFAIYGFLLVWGHLAIIALDPVRIVQYFGIFLNYAPPILLIIAAVIIISIVMIEVKHV